MKQLKVLVTGSRDWTDDIAVYLVLNGFRELAENLGEELVIIEGGARGADELARSFANEFDVKLITVEADWENEGKAAGPIRNQKMLSEQDPDYVVGFSKMPITRGTQHMLHLAKRHKVPSYHIVPIA